MKLGLRVQGVGTVKTVRKDCWIQPLPQRNLHKRPGAAGYTASALLPRAAKGGPAAL